MDCEKPWLSVVGRSIVAPLWPAAARLVLRCRRLRPSDPLAGSRPTRQFGAWLLPAGVLFVTLPERSAANLSGKRHRGDVWGPSMRGARAGSQRMARTALARAPWAILLVVVAQVPPKLWLSASYIGRLPLNERIPEVLFVALPVPFAAVGALIAGRRPGHRIGWLLLVGALAISTAQLTWSYVIYGLDYGVHCPGPRSSAGSGTGSPGRRWPPSRSCWCCSPTANLPHRAGGRWPGPWWPGAR